MNLIKHTVFVKVAIIYFVYNHNNFHNIGNKFIGTLKI